MAAYTRPPSGERRNRRKSNLANEANCTSYAFGGGLNRTPILMCVFWGQTMLVPYEKVVGKNWMGGAMYAGDYRNRTG